MKKSVIDFAAPVHKSLLQPDFFAGVPKNLFYILMAVGLLLTQIIGKFAILVVIVIYVPCRIISKKDPHLLSIGGLSLFEPNHLEG